MDNHVHILIKTENNPVGQLICRINSKYAKYYNKKYNCMGHLFQDRYYSELIESDSQMLEASRYKHLNPMMASIVRRPENYKWSSYLMYIDWKREELICNERLQNVYVA